MGANHTGLAAVDLGPIALLKVLEPAGGPDPDRKALGLASARRRAVVDPAPQHGPWAGGADGPPPPLQRKVLHPRGSRVPGHDAAGGRPPLADRLEGLRRLGALVVSIMGRLTSRGTPLPSKR